MYSMLKAVPSDMVKVLDVAETKKETERVKEMDHYVASVETPVVRLGPKPVITNRTGGGGRPGVRLKRRLQSRNAAVNRPN